MPFLDEILTFVVNLILPMSAGYLLRRLGWVSERLLTRVLSLSFPLFATVLALSSLWKVELRMQLLWLPVMGAAMQVVGGLLGWARARLRGGDPLEKGSFVLSMMLSNRGVAGRLTVYVLYPVIGYAYCEMVMLLAPVVVFLVAFPMARHFHATHHGGQGRLELKKLLVHRNQLPLLGVAAGLTLNAWGPAFPESLGRAFPVVLSLFMWSVLVPAGFSLRFGHMRRYLRSLPDLLAVKFLLTPAIVGGLAWAVGLRAELLNTVIILSAAPTAINAITVSRLEGLSVDLAATCFFVTTAVYLAGVVPVVLWLLGG